MAKVFLTYCADNHEVADQLVADLGRVGINFRHDMRLPGHRLDSEMANENAPIYLFISDNFLKSENCMDGALKFIDNFRLKPRIKPIVIDGVTEKNGKKEYVPTKFDKVSNVIRYMNHWQDEYLRLRRERRDVPAHETDAFQAKIDKIRKISNEIGEFLRSLRGFNYISFDDFKSGKFKRLFDDLGYDGNELYNKYVLLPPPPVTVEVPPPVETDVPPIDLSIIPGIDLINKKEEIPADDTPEPTVDEDSIEMETPLEENLEILDTPKEDVVEEVETPIKEVIEEVETPDDDDEIKGGTPSEEPPIELESADNYGEVPEDAESFVKEMVEDQGHEEEVVEEVEKTVDTDQPSDLIEKVEDEVERSLEIINEKVVEVVEEKTEEVTENLEVIEEQVEENLEQIEDGIEESINDITEEVEEIVNEIEEVEHTDTPEIEEEEIKEEVENLGDTVKDEENSLDSSIDETELTTIEDDEEALDESIENETEEVVDDKELVEDLANEIVYQLNEDTTNEAGTELENAELVHASTLANNEDLEAAKQKYLELIAEHPQDASIKLAYATLLQDKIKDDLAAKAVLEDIMLSDQANELVYYRLGLIAEADGEFRVAKNYYERAISTRRDFADAYFRLGEIMASYYDNQQFVAKAYFQEAIRLSGGNPAMNFRFAQFLSEKMKDHKKAKDILLQLTNADENNARATYALAELFLHAFGKKKKARKYYLEACDIDATYQTEANDTLFKVQRAKPKPEPQQVAPIALATSSDIKTVLVTGATSGIGKAIAELFASQGHRVIITGRRADRLETVAAALKEQYNNDINTLSFDVRNHEAAEAALNELSEEWHDIDILINNAGLAKGFHDINEGKLDHWETMIDTNFKGLLYMTRLVSPGMVGRKKGHIINIGSIAGKEVYPKGNVYCATKSAVDALTKGTRIDLHKHNIRVTAIHPGHVETEFAEVRFDGDKERAKIYEDFQPLTAQDVAETVFFVATRPAHVNIEDIVMWSTQQASATIIDRSGR